MTQQDSVEFVAGLVVTTLAFAVVETARQPYGWLREAGAIICLGFSGFVMQQVSSRYIASRKTR